MDIICKKIANAMIYAYHRGRFWRWDPSRSVWKESHLMTAKFQRAKAALRTLTPESFFSDSGEFALLDNYEISLDMTEALANAKPCQSAPVDPVEETPDTPDPAGDPLPAPAAPEGTSPVTETDGAVPSTISAPAFESPAAPGFDFGADERTNALLLQDAQTFITGNMARIMAAKHAHDLTASHYKGSWGKWCAAVGISRDTGDNMVRVAEQFGNIQLEGKSILDVQPMKLLYAAAKPSTPEVVKQAVFTGDITTYKEYQELMAQLKAEKERADAAETREEEARSMVSKAQDEAQTAKNDLEVALVDLNGLTEQNAKLQQSYHDADEDRIAARLQCQKAEGERDRAEERAKDAENQLTGSRQVAEAAKLRGDKLKAENDALKKQPITTVVDKEEVERQAREMAAEMTADLRAQLEQAASGSEQDVHSSYDNVLLADRSLQNIGKMVVPSLRRLPPEQREQLTNMLVHTLGQIQGEVSRCL